MKRRPTRTKLGKGLYLNRDSEGHFTSWTQRGSNTTINSSSKGGRYTLKSGKLFKQIYARVKPKRSPKPKFPKVSSRKYKPLRAVAEKVRRPRRSGSSGGGGDGILFLLIALFVVIGLTATLISYAIGVLLVGWLVVELFDGGPTIRWFYRITYPFLILTSFSLYQLQPEWLLKLDRVQRSFMWFGWEDAPAGFYSATGVPSLVVIIVMTVMWLLDFFDDDYNEEEDFEIEEAS
jgi:hypothetical protein